MPRKIIIAAMDKNGLIGTNEGKGLPWDIPEEYEQYLKKVAGQTVIMGRKTYELSGYDLTSQFTFIISRDFPRSEKYIVCSTVDEALKKAEAFGKDIYIAGGSSIYAQTLGLADYMHLSYIKGEYSGTSYFPEFNHHQWEVEKREDFPRYELVIYRRKR